MKRNFFTKMALGFLSVCALVLGAVGLNSPTSEITASAETHSNHTEWGTLKESAGTLIGNGKLYVPYDMEDMNGVTIQSGSSITLCLNGKSLNMGYNYITVENGATLTICDCQGTGSIVSESTTAVGNTSSVSACIYNNGGTVTLSGGTVDGPVAIFVGSNNYSGIVNVSGGTATGEYGIYAKNNSTVNITGGKVTGSVSGVEIWNTATVNISGGEVESRYSGTSNLYAAVRTRNTSTAKISGGTLSYLNNAYYGVFDMDCEGNIYLSGTPSISGTTAAIGVRKLNGKQTSLYAAIEGVPYTGAALSIASYDTFAEGDVIVSGVSDNKDKFTWSSSKDEYMLWLAEGENTLVLQPLHSHVWAPDWSRTGEAHWRECTANYCDITDNTKKDGYGTHAPVDDNDCTTAVKCDICQYTFKAANEAHSFDDDCTTADKCANCAQMATVNSAHTFDGDCTTADKCANCAVNATANEAHSFDNDCTTNDKCANCAVNATANAHVYDNACDAICNECNAEREIRHTYDNDCDNECNVCHATRTVGEHIYGADNTCDECGYEKPTDVAPPTDSTPPIASDDKVEDETPENPSGSSDEEGGIKIGCFAQVDGSILFVLGLATLVVVLKRKMA